MKKKYLLVTLGGCLMGLAVWLVVVLTNPDADNSPGELVGLAFGASLLGGALTWVRYYAQGRARAAGRALRDRDDGVASG